jgi:hypothetical protein
MPAERTRVGVILNGVPQFYQRDREEKRGNKFVAVPFFVVNINEAATMTEGAAKMFVARLQSLGVTNAWIEDCKDGRGIEFASESTQSGEDDRTAVAASLDDVNFYVVKPICRPDGRKWFIRIDVPGIAQPQVVYADDALGVLQRAEDMGFLQHAVKYERPQPQQAPATHNSRVGFRRRPGDIT